MSLLIKNLDTVDIEIDDLGLTLPASAIIDLSSEEAADVAESATGGDLDTEITALRIAALDPLDGTTKLNVADSLEALRAHNDAQYRIKAGELHQLDDVDISLVGSPETPTPTVGDILQYGGGSPIRWTNIPATSLSTDTDRIQYIHVGKHGNDANNGLTPNKAKLTFGAALATASAGSPVPSSTNRINIVCEDGGTYVEDFTIPSWVFVKAPNATFDGTFTLSDDSEFVFQEALNASTGSPAEDVITKAPGSTGTGWATGEIVRATGTTNGLTNASSASVLIVRVRQVFVEDGVGILDTSTGTGHIHMDVEDLYITGTGTAIDRQSSTGIIVGRVSHILEIGGGVGFGTAIDVTDGNVTLNVGSIETTTAYVVAGAGTLNMIANDIADSAVRVQSSGLAKVNVVEADSFRWQNKTVDFTARRAEFVAIDTSGSPGPVTMFLPNPASDGDSVTFQDAVNSFGTNALTVDAQTGGLIGPLSGSPTTAQTIVLDLSGTAGVFIYNSTLGYWTLSRIQEEIAFSPSNLIYVTKNGDDILGDGSFSNPFLTIKRGITEALSRVAGSPVVPTTVKILDGIYDEDNPLIITGPGSEFVNVQGESENSVFVEPSNVGNLFELHSNDVNNGPSLNRLFLRNEDSTYRNPVGSPAPNNALVYVEGDGTFILDKINLEGGRRGLDIGNGTITNQTVRHTTGTILNNSVGLEAKNDNTTFVGQIIFFEENDTNIIATDDVQVDVGNYVLAGNETGQSGSGIILNDTATFIANGGTIRNLVTGLVANDDSVATIVATFFRDNTVEFNQVSTTAVISIRGVLSKTKQLISDGANVSLNYIDTDTNDFIVGNADLTGDPGKEFRVRDTDGRVAIGDNAIDENIATGTVGASRSVNLIDENGTFRIWRFSEVDGEDPAVEWVKGINPSLPDDVGDTAISSITAGTDTITIDVSGTDYNDPFDVPYGINRLTLANRAFPPGREIRVNGTGSNDGDYVVSSAIYTGGTPDPETIDIVVTTNITVSEGAGGEVVWGGGAGRPDGVSTYVGDPGGAVAAGTGNVRWDMFLQEDDYFVIRRRTDGGGGIPNEKTRIYPDHSEWLGSTLHDDSDNATILYLQTIASAVNYLQVDNAATGNGPEISAQGTDANIDIEMIPVGTGTVLVPAGYEANIVDDSLITKAYVDAEYQQSYMFRHNNTTTQTFTAATTINFGTAVREDADYTHAIVTGGSEITINTDGWYKITYEVTADNNAGGRRTATHELELNATFVSGSRSHSYHRNAANGEDTATATVILVLSATDVLRVRSSATASITTVAHGCRLNIERLNSSTGSP